MKKLRCNLAVLALALSGLPALAQPAPPRILEAYPPHIQQKLDARDLKVKEALAASSGRITTMEFVNVTSRWQPGQTVTVAFRGGSQSLYGNIAAVAGQWVTNGNIHFDFGPQAAQGIYREWSTADTDYAADIRVAFDDRGYWSYIGVDSRDATLGITPTNTSLNLEGFDTNLPYDWTALVLHEFGHALGFMHEHQSPASDCASEFRWNDDPGYMSTTDSYGQFISYTDTNGKVSNPGVYTVLEGPLNYWTKEMVDSNLTQVPVSHAYHVGPFDVHSVMMYSFDASLYLNGTNASCYTLENTNLSDGDRRGVAELYPFEPSGMNRVMAEKRALLQKILSSKKAAPELKKNYSARLQSLQ